ncbi:MAG TPA: NAD-dependent epimerase/dehydratase family protein [Firmicutes bacterium]|nr:NAD-dependent epimerase/dehydratase family protein [Bacillota bacterium]
MDSVYLLTGITGHLGNAVARELAARGKKVRGLVLPTDDIEGKFPPGIEFYRGDVTRKESLRPFFAGLKGKSFKVIHAAGIVSIASRAERKMQETNVGGTENIISLCREYGAAKLVYVSSVHALPELPHGQVISEIKHFDPALVVGPYAKTKAAATALALKAAAEGLNVSVVHPSGIVGPFDYGRGHLTQMVLDYCKGRLFAGVDGGYDFVDVRDVAWGVIAACERGAAGECYLLSNKWYSVADMFGQLYEITGFKKINTYLPLWFAKLTAPLSELYYKLRRQTPLFTSYSLYTLASNANFSNAKAKAELGYKTRSFQETLRDTVAWLKEQGRI